MTMEFFKDFDQNSGCQPKYPIIQMTMKFFQELDDHRILVKFFQYLIRIFQDIDDREILTKLLKGCDQNSVGKYKL